MTRPTWTPAIFELGIPILGFCYGQQIMAVKLGGSVGHTEVGEYGHGAAARVRGRVAPYWPRPAGESERVDEPPRRREPQCPRASRSPRPPTMCPVASMECAERNLYATQFHPEVRHTPLGQASCCSNFLFDICGLVRRSWTMANVAEENDRRDSRKGGATTA